MKHRDSVTIADGKKKPLLMYGVMVLYALILINMLFFGYRSPIGGFSGTRGDYRSLNVIPFRSIWEYLSGNHFTLMINNVLGNIVVFIPLGIYISILRKGKGVLLSLLYVFLSSILIEIMQFAFTRGTSDIDDVLLNLIGGLFGIWIYKWLVLLSKTEQRAQLIITILSLVVGLPMFVIIMIRS